MDNFLDLIQQYIEETDLSLVSIVLLSILGFSFIVQLFFYLYYFNSTIRRSKALHKGRVSHAIKRMPVSVIVTSKFATEELEQFLPKVLDQNYPEYEVIVVNDGATDASTVLLDNLKKKHKNLKTSFLPMNAKYMSRRKMCITVGVKAASYDYIVVTDSDCAPDSRDWLSEMMRNFVDGTEIVLGYAHPEQTKTGFLASLLKFDALFSAIKYFGYALHGVAYKGTARNMVFKKDTFFRCKGYASHLDLEKGEDDIFVSENNNGKNVGVEISPSSFITTFRERTFKQYVISKDLNCETGVFLPSGIKFRIALELLTRFLFYFSIIYLFVIALLENCVLLYAVVGALALIRYSIQCYTFTVTAHKFREKGYAGKFILFEILIPLLTLYIITFGRIGKKRQDLWRV